MIKGKIITTRKLRSLGEQLRAEGKTIAFTAGAFDLLHIGQIRYLAKAKALGDILVVGVASDESQRRLKGLPFPIMDEKIRSEMVAFLRPVDFVVLGVRKENLTAPLKALRPHIFFTPWQDWQRGLRTAKEERVVGSYGGKVVRIPYIKPYLSTVEIAKKVAFIRIQQVMDQRLGDRELGPIYKGGS